MKEIKRFHDGSYLKEVEITPEFAKNLIEKSKDFKNRRLDKKRVQCYAEDMLNGNWHGNLEPIRINKAGKLQDGQTRLHACIKSGVSYYGLVQYDCPDDYMDCYDTGRNRTVQTTFGIYHPEDKKYFAIVKDKIALDKGIMATGQSCTNLGIRVDDVNLDFDANKEEYKEAFGVGSDIHYNYTPMTVNEVASIYMHLTNTLKQNKEKVTDFFMKLSTGSKSLHKCRENITIKKGAERRIEFAVAWKTYKAKRIASSVKREDVTCFK